MHLQFVGVIPSEAHAAQPRNDQCNHLITIVHAAYYTAHCLKEESEVSARDECSGNRSVTSSVDALDRQPLSEIPSEVTDAVESVVCERKSKSEASGTLEPFGEGVDEVDEVGRVQDGEPRVEEVGHGAGV